MIRPTNISKNSKKADFHCAIHGGTVKNLNLMTKTNRRKSSVNSPEGEDLIDITGAELTPSCGCVTSFPAWDPGNKLGHELGQARPND